MNMLNAKIWAIVAARAGSKGLLDKNVRNLAGKPLIAHAINFAVQANIFEKILLSTDSDQYAEIGREYGAWVPFLRGSHAAQDDSMEEHVLKDLDEKLKIHNISPPDIIVWLRPTFPFRSTDDLTEAVSMLNKDIDSVRMVTTGEPRLYEVRNGFLSPCFDDGGRSMIRRQEFPPTYKVFHTDIFWYKNIVKGELFLGERILALPIHRLCAMDIDGIDDFEIVDALIASKTPLIEKYVS
ncbi:acylneuraminate cytidylyltransferase family protein [Synechococcus sp. UW105]|uniref:acylneuraminate cytidylyltransferase family protein n=1 Tax=Synechococcus sp. UW105 TaxID=337067 RepID=UPI000E0FC41C|nr:acylneuraminate cytidylyltransferase family protein [Synechococcus sp. UW105]